MDISTTDLDDKLHWYKDAIIYELHIKAFKDSSGDGIGDFEGLIERLDYLQNLGITAVWVLPFYPSPLRDDGYDIADYYSINPAYGDIDQFKKFLEEAHNRGLKVITELVINHTSDTHPWFQRARKAPKGSPERDYYVWTDNPGQYKDVRIIFQDFEKSNWTWDPLADQYYWHRFFHHQPDLNYDSQLVQEEVFKIIDYWCSMGVDGFRLDAVPYLYEREGTNGENLPETHAYLKKLRAHVDEHYPGTVLLAEANMWPEDSASYFGNGDECQMNYHFPVMPRMFMALQMEDRYPITDIFDQTPAIPDTCQWAIFLRNHDELTLEMVTDEERDYMYKAYAKDPKARINLGIRHRLAPLMENNRRKIELMNVLLFSLAGTPVIYYGDEIGMGDNVYLGDRDGVRTPMQWTQDRNGGFSEANPQKLYLPLILDAEYAYESLNVEEQERNPSSLLWFMKSIISMRKKYKAFGRGDLSFVSLENPKVLAFTRNYNDESILVVVNLSRYAQPAELNLEKYKGSILVDVYSKNKFPAITEAPYFFTLTPHACMWFEIKKQLITIADHSTLPQIKISAIEDILKGRTRELIENNIIPDHILTTHWFTGASRNIYSIKISNGFGVPLANNNALFLLLDVNYESGMPETYQFPVALIKNTGEATAIDPRAKVCRVLIENNEFLLVDALYLPEVQQALFKHLAGNKMMRFPSSQVSFIANKEVEKYLLENAEIKSKVLPVEDYNTSIGYDNKYFLKLYRQVERAINPDVEVTYYLTFNQKLPAVPDYLGAIEWRVDGQTMVLGMLQPLVEYHGNGRTYMAERLHDFQERIVTGNNHPLSVIKTSLLKPVAYETVAPAIQDFIGGNLAEDTRLLGIRTGEMHKALAAGINLADFKPEDFSLHYQRSLFSGLQTLVRATFQNLGRYMPSIPEELRQEAQEILGRKEEILKLLRNIYTRKLNVTRTRIHGHYQLRRVLFTGKDIALLDFGGNPTRSYSERRIKRSPYRDVAGMIRSFYYAAYEGLVLDKKLRKEDLVRHEPYITLWIHHVARYFLDAYQQTVKGESFTPTNEGDLQILLQTFLLEKALHSLNYELTHRPEYVIIPLRFIKDILSK